MPSVSVIIPTYNHRDFIVATLNSVFAQTFTDYEIIVINDGSPDDTADVLKTLISGGCVRYIEQPNAGQAAARNRGLSEASGEFIAYLDDDDLWPADKLQWQVQRLRDESGLGMVAGAMQTLGDDTDPVTPEDTPPVIAEFEQLFYGCPLTSPGQALIRADVLESLGGFDVSVWGADDYDLWFRLTRAARVELWQRVALYYRRHSLNASRNLPRMYHNSEVVLKRYSQFLPKHKRSSSSRNAARYLYEYAGKQIMLQAKSLTVRGHIKHALRTASVLRGLLVPMVLDPKLASRIGRDLIFSSARVVDAPP